MYRRCVIREGDCGKAKVSFGNFIDLDFPADLESDGLERGGTAHSHVQYFMEVNDSEGFL